MPTKLFFNPNAHMISVVLANNETMFPEKLTFCKIFLYSIFSLIKKGLYEGPFYYRMGLE